MLRGAIARFQAATSDSGRLAALLLIPAAATRAAAAAASVSDTTTTPDSALARANDHGSGLSSGPEGPASDSPTPRHDSSHRPPTDPSHLPATSTHPPQENELLEVFEGIGTGFLTRLLQTPAARLPPGCTSDAFKQVAAAVLLVLTQAPAVAGHTGGQALYPALIHAAHDVLHSTCGPAPTAKSAARPHALARDLLLLAWRVAVQAGDSAAPLLQAQPSLDELLALLLLCRTSAAPTTADDLEGAEAAAGADSSACPQAAVPAAMLSSSTSPPPTAAQQCAILTLSLAQLLIASLARHRQASLSRAGAAPGSAAAARLREVPLAVVVAEATAACIAGRHDLVKVVAMDTLAQLLSSATAAQPLRPHQRWAGHLRQGLEQMLHSRLDAPLRRRVLRLASLWFQLENFAVEDARLLVDGEEDEVTDHKKDAGRSPPPPLLLLLAQAAGVEARMLLEDRSIADIVADTAGGVLAADCMVVLEETLRFLVTREDHPGLDADHIVPAYQAIVAGGGAVLSFFDTLKADGWGLERLQADPPTARLVLQHGRFLASFLAEESEALRAEIFDLLPFLLSLLPLRLDDAGDDMGNDAGADGDAQQYAVAGGDMLALFAGGLEQLVLEERGRLLLHEAAQTRQAMADGLFDRYLPAVLADARDMAAASVAERICSILVYMVEATPASKVVGSPGYRTLLSRGLAFLAGGAVLPRPLRAELWALQAALVQAHVGATGASKAVDDGLAAAADALAAFVVEELQDDAETTVHEEQCALAVMDMLAQHLRVLAALRQALGKSTRFLQSLKQTAEAGDVDGNVDGDVDNGKAALAGLVLTLLEP